MVSDYDFLLTALEKHSMEYFKTPGSPSAHHTHSELGNHEPALTGFVMVRSTVGMPSGTVPCTSLA